MEKEFIIFALLVLITIISTLFLEYKRPYKTYSKIDNSKVHNIRQGFSWSLFWFSGLFGIPCFISKLWKWGVANLILISMNFVPNETVVLIGGVLHFFLLLYLGVYGNRLKVSKLHLLGYEAN